MRISISPYSVQMRENADQNNSEYGHFSRSDSVETKRLRTSITEDFKTADSLSSSFIKTYSRQK